MSAPQLADVKRWILGLLPPGNDQLISWADGDGGTGDYYGAVAEAVKAYGTDLIETLRQNVNPATADQKVVDWLAVLGLAEAVQGKTTQQKIDAVVAALREHGASTLDNIRGGVQSIVQYADPSQIEVVECDRSALTTAHTYALAPHTEGAGGGTYQQTFTVLDTASVALCNATLNLDLTATEVSELQFELLSPDGDSVFVFNFNDVASGSVTNETYVLRDGPVRVETGIFGLWTLSVISAGTGYTINSGSVFVEGIGRVDFTPVEGLGSAQFDWGVLVDPALAVSGVDYNAVDRVIQRWNPAHCIGNVIRGTIVGGANNEAVPDDDPQIPTNAIPDQCIPG